jgi:hypothetical protein
MQMKYEKKGTELMNKKRWIMALAAALLLTGCTQPGAEGTPGTTAGATPQATAAYPTPTVSVSQAGEKQTDFTGLLPAAVGYHWMYEGFAEYSHEMTLDAIEHSGTTTVYRISGEVGDPSGGESQADHSLSIVYTLQPGVWVQQAQGQLLMDSEFSRLELLRGPLAEGTQWTQTVAGASGEPITLVCTIESVVNGGDGGAVYTVAYRQQNSDYYERREIAEGRGVIAFEKLYVSESGESSPIGYRTYRQNEETPAPSATLQPVLSLASEMNAWLPPLNREMRFFGLAEYGHNGSLSPAWSTASEGVYLFSGVYNDGVGTPDPFSVRYYLDYGRGTVTEKVMSNARRGKAEINSKIHNLVALKFPLALGKTWHWEARVEGLNLTIEAKIIELSDDKAVVRYTAVGVPGYYDDTYFEERTFEKGYGMTGFSMLMKGEPEISAEDARDPEKVRQALVNQLMFGYSQDKYWLNTH